MLNSILIIEDDDGIREYLRELLLDNQFSVRDTTKGLEGLSIAERIQPDLVLLDLVLPDIAGEEVCRSIKKLLPNTAVIILTAKDNPSDVVRGLDLGADDYIAKPFTSEELMARIKARLRTNVDNNSQIIVGDLSLDQKTLEVKRGSRSITLTPQEFRLLEYLMSNKNNVLSREMILNKIWQYAPDVESRVVDVYIGYLRNKIDKGFKQKFIHSVRGFGYVIKDPK